MNIICPHCNQVFNLDEDIAFHLREQVRNNEFEREVNERVAIEKQLVEQSANIQIEKKIIDLQLEKTENELKSKQQEISIRNEYEEKICNLKKELKDTEFERDYYKDLKSKMSTKMIGETLEQHCEIEFNKIRMTAFPKAIFEKDNKVSKESGSKGDYIFREFDDDGVEIISIMFEMKNQNETTSSKKTNEHFFKELDKDRREKHCEYAILVSLLEENNELYNQGITDVSYQYEKMYVIRPQFFIPIITLLRNAALNSLNNKKELVRIQNENIDIANFKNNFEKFKTSFTYNCEQADKKLNDTIEEIDKVIAKLQNIRDAVTSSDKQLSQANKKIENITVENLCKNSPILLDKLN